VPALRQEEESPIVLRASVTPALLAAGLALVAGCSPRPTGPSVLLVSIDSLRYDEIGNTVGGQPTVPRLTAFARQSVSFARTVAAAPWTTPSMMSVMTGMPPRAHGVGGYDRTLSASVPQLAQRFRDAGYETAAIVSAQTLRKAFGFGPGFETYDLGHYGHSRISSPELAAKVIGQIERSRGRPFFLWVHLWDPHYNYLPPPPADLFRAGERPPSEDLQCLRWYENAVTPEQAEYLRAKYRGELLFTDTHFGRILDALEKAGIADEVIVAVMGDHGEAFLEHGWLTHARQLHEPAVHVPLMLRWPGRLAPRSDSTVVSTAQLGRTLLQLAGLDDTGFGIEEALPVAGPAGGAASERIVMTETTRDACATALVGPRYKYVLDVLSCRERLFDLAVDPGELADIAGAHPELVVQFRSVLKERLDSIAARNVPQAMQSEEVVQNLEKALRSIGYVGGKKEGQGRQDPECAVAPGATRPPAMGDVGGPQCPSEGPVRCLGGAS